MNYLVYKNGFHLPHDFLKIKVLLFAGISTYNKHIYNTRKDNTLFMIIELYKRKCVLYKKEKDI